MKNALYIVWNKNNELRIPIIDEQHRGIVTTINSFHYFIKEGSGLDALKPTFIILAQYINIHFKTEEALMKAAGYNGLEEHLVLHRELIKRTQAIARGAVSYKEPEIALSFLKEWWIGHINQKDKKYASQVKKMLGI